MCMMNTQYNVLFSGGETVLPVARVPAWSEGDAASQAGLDPWRAPTWCKPLNVSKVTAVIDVSDFFSTRFSTFPVNAA
jgi:hypothetical protein